MHARDEIRELREFIKVGKLDTLMQAKLLRLANWTP